MAKVKVEYDWIEDEMRPFIAEDIERGFGTLIDIPDEKLSWVKEAMANYEKAMDILDEYVNKAKEEAEEAERLENPRTKGDMIRKMAKEQGWEIIELKCAFDPADFRGLPFDARWDKHIAKLVAEDERLELERFSPENFDKSVEMDKLMMEAIMEYEDFLNKKED